MNISAILTPIYDTWSDDSQTIHAKKPFYKILDRFKLFKH